MKDLQIRIAGIGGQGVVTAADLIGRTALDMGMFVTGSSRYGSAARGTPVRADLVLSSEPIDDPHVHEPHWLIAMSQEAYDEYNKKVFKGDARILYDPDLVEPANNQETMQIPIEALKTALHKLGNRQSANMVMVGAFLAQSGLFSLDDIKKAVHEYVPERFQDINIKALNIGFELGASYKGGSKV
ncbi:MAG: 2-oxoacid:ferredoxin oxidoreductase subunit gamma [Deltaproteobacteria bacterium]|nr:2-oxoacid:ferredoxin oxidoreductase subunit gamma [Deltaproteobacteria bacterium]